MSWSRQSIAIVSCRECVHLANATSKGSVAYPGSQLLFAPFCRSDSLETVCFPWSSLSPTGVCHELSDHKTLSSRGLGHRPFTAVTRVRIPLGSPMLRRQAQRASDVQGR